MRKTTLLVKNRLGVHARASTKLAYLANFFDCDIRLRQRDCLADAKSLMALMLVAAQVNTHVDLICDGIDEDEATEMITRLFEVGFFELDNQDDELRDLLERASEKWLEKNT